MTEWTFLTDHGHVLVCLARDSYASNRALADRVSVPEDRAEAIVANLIEAGYVAEQREGSSVVRRVVNRKLPLRHPVESHHPVGHLLDAVQSPADVLRSQARQGD